MSKAKHISDMTAQELQDFTQSLPGRSTMDPTRKILGGGAYHELLERKAGVYPVMANRLAKEVATLLNHKTGITARAWFALMPSRSAFDWAIKATKAMSSRGATSYFLKCLHTAFQGGEKYVKIREWARPFIEAALGPGAADAEPIVEAGDVDFLRAHGLEREGCPGCESCWDVKMRVQARTNADAAGRWGRQSGVRGEAPVPAVS